MKPLLSLQAYSGRKICVACSGGADSVALLHAFYTQAKSYNILLTAVTCEHGIRGESSLRDAAFVRKLCAEWNIPLFEFSADVLKLSKESGRGVEEEARLFRYRCFEQIVAKEHADAVATAHHRDDFIDTVLFRLIRGTSLSGLGAIEEREGIIRPLLSVTRAQIMAYVRDNALPHVEDESNQDERYTRNYLRKSVLPALERAVNGAGEHLAEFAVRAKQDDEYLQSLAREQIITRKDERLVPVRLPDPLFFRACLQCIKEDARDYTSAQLTEIARLKSLQSGRKVCLPCNKEAMREGDYIVFYRPQEAFEGEIPFALGEFTIGEHTAKISTENAPNALFADLDGFPQGCVIRTRRAGDKFTPFKGTEKPLKEFLTDKKIPARIGRSLPLVAKGSEVYAVFGVEISDKVKVKKDTGTTVYFTCADRKINQNTEEEDR